MEIINHVLSLSADWIREYIQMIGLSFVATFITVFGNDITKLIKTQIGSLNFFLKISLFIIFCAFGFAFLISFLTPLLTKQLASLNDLWINISVLIMFYFLGFMAQKKGMI